MENKKITIHSEFAYIFATVILAFAVAMATAADFGISMTVAPAYIISQKFKFLTFGQSEYVLQAIMFVVLCLLLKKFRISYLFSFVTCLFYGAVLDLWRIIIPHFNPAVTPAGSMSFLLRAVYFVLSILITSFSIALYYRIYIPSQVYDYFTKSVAEFYNINKSKFKIWYDAGSLAVSVALTLAFFGKFIGIGVGTFIITAVNGLLIGFFGKMLDKCVEFKPLFSKFSKLFDIT